MDQDQNVAPAPVTPEPEPVAKEAAKGAAYGTVLGIILIVVILVMGAFYVWGARLNNEQIQPEAESNALESAIEIDTSVPQPN